MTGYPVRNVLVVGAASGIGAALAHHLAGPDARLALADRAGAALERMAEELSAAAFEVDIADPAQVTSLFDAVEDRLGPVDVLVNTAAISPSGEGGGALTMAQTSLELLHRVIDTNLMGTLYLGREYALRVAGQGENRRPGGRVVFLSSTAAQIGGYQSASAYIASKGGVLAFTKTLARELAPFGVTVNCVAPGLIETPMLRGVLTEDRDAEAVRGVPLQRLGDPAEVAAAIAYLLSRDAGYVTGTTLDINGGYNMR